MAMCVVNGAPCQCTFGVAPSPIVVTSQMQCIGCNMPVASIMDKPLAPFGMCMSIANPVVAAATAAALGVLTPMPCTPVLPSPWVPGAPTVIVGGKPLLNNSSKLMCVYGGVISIVVTPAATIQVP